MNEVMSKNTHDLDITEFVYNGKDSKSVVKCNVCGHVWETTPKILLGNHGCPICTTKNRNSQRRLKTEDVVKSIKDKYGDKFILDKVEYFNARTKILVGCKKHGYFPIRYHDLMYNHGCPICNESRLEAVLENVLSQENINYERQYSFDWMKTSTYGKLSYDFFFPQLNLAIECQGRQHFEVVNAFGGESEFKKVFERDEEKVKRTNEHSIKLIYFLDKRFNKYMKEDDLYFNNVEELISYIKTLDKKDEET